MSDHRRGTLTQYGLLGTAPILAVRPPRESGASRCTGPTTPPGQTSRWPLCPCESCPVLALAVLLLIPLAWGMVAGRLARWSITAPIAMVAVGVAVTAGSEPMYHVDLETSVIEHFVEVVLAVVLFVDASEVEGGFFGHEPRLTARLLL